MRRILILLAAGATFLHAADDGSTILPPGTPAPTFSIPALDGSRESLRMWCGDNLVKPHINDKFHTVIISFWATYCKPCQKEIPELHSFYKKHSNDPIKIFLISIDEKGADIVVPFVEEKKYTLPVLLDPYKKTAERYGVKSLPALFVVDPKGIIRYSAVGYKEEVSLEETLEKVYKAVKAGKEVKVAGSGGQGESVAVRQEEVVAVTVPHFTSKQKWSAVAKIECGLSPDVVAKEMSVSKEDLKKWYTELKEAACTLWDSQSPEKK